MFFDIDLRIDQIHEKPDFILTNGKERLGLEHQIVVDDKSKEREGFIENLFA